MSPPPSLPGHHRQHRIPIPGVTAAGASSYLGTTGTVAIHNTLPATTPSTAYRMEGGKSCADASLPLGKPRH